MERLTSIGGNRRAGWALHAVLVVVVIFARDLMPNRFEVFNLELLGLYLIGVIGLNLLATTGLLSIGTSALYLVGGYTVTILTVTHDWSFWPALIVGGVICGLLGVLLGVPALRLGVFTLAMITFGYAIVAEKLAIEWRGLTGGANGLLGAKFPEQFDDLESYYWVVAVAVVLTYALNHNLMRSPFGRAGRAVALQPVAAQAVGIEGFRLRLTGFAVSSALAGLAGGLYVPLLGFIAPDAFTVHLAILLLLMAMLGGSGSVAGPVIGTIVLFRLPIEVSRYTDQPGEWALFVYGVILILSVHFVPKGLMGAWFTLRTRFATTVQRRRDRGTVAAGRPAADIALALERTPATDEPLLDVRRAAINLGGVQALAGLDFRLDAGTVHALIGPNGSGKTTFLNSVSGFIALDDGEELVLGEDVRGMGPVARARLGVGRTFQTPLVFGEMSCLENVLVAVDMHRRRSLFAYGVRLLGARREERENYEKSLLLLRAVGLESRQDDAAGDLPPGQLRLLEIARVVAMQPRLVLMDEPAAGLTSEEIAELEVIILAMRDVGIGVVLVEHHAAMVMRVSDVVTVIDFGRILAEGTPAEVQSNPKVLSAYLGSSLEEDAESARVEVEVEAESTDALEPR